MRKKKEKFLFPIAYSFAAESTAGSRHGLEITTVPSPIQVDSRHQIFNVFYSI
jgi:hypothetical protein